MENSLKLSLESTVMYFRPILGRKDNLLGKVTNLIVFSKDKGTLLCFSVLLKLI